jgi:hypothetical protein
MQTLSNKALMFTWCVSSDAVVGTYPYIHQRQFAKKFSAKVNQTSSDVLLHDIGTHPVAIRKA